MKICFLPSLRLSHSVGSIRDLGARDFPWPLLSPFLLLPLQLLLLLLLLASPPLAPRIFIIFAPRISDTHLKAERGRVMKNRDPFRRDVDDEKCFVRLSPAARITLVLLPPAYLLPLSLSFCFFFTPPTR